MVDLIRTNVLKIPLKDLSPSGVKEFKSLQKSLYAEAECKACKHYADRHSVHCDPCSNFIGTYKFYKKTKEEMQVYCGDKNLVWDMVTRHVKKPNVIDKRTTTPFSVEGIRANTKIAYEYQTKAVDDWYTAGGGTLCSKPRTGKTYMSAMLAIRRQQKTLILAHQTDLLKQFYNTFCNIDTGDIKFTNIPRLQEATGKSIVKICNTYQDFLDNDICLVNYQKFISEKGQKLLKKIKSLFGTVIIDEIHKMNSPHYSNVVSQLNASGIFGMTATYKRKDQREFIATAIVGGIVHTTPASGMTPMVTITKTNWTPPQQDYKQWVSAMRAIERAPKRNELIVKHVIHDLKAGHNILIPVLYQSHIQSLITMINKAAKKAKIDYRAVAEGYHGKLSQKNKDLVLNRARSGDIRVVVAQRTMLTGINVARWSAIYEVVPCANKPNFKQEYERVCTPFENKKPIIRMFVDDWGLSESCFFICWSVLKAEGDGVAYSDKAKEIVKTLYASSKLRRAESTKDLDDAAVNTSYRRSVARREAPPVKLLVETVL